MVYRLPLPGSDRQFSSVGTLFGPWIRPLWSVYRTLSGLLVLAAGFALLLQAYATAQRAAVVIDGPPQHEAFEYPDGRNGRPTLRVPLGAKKMSYMLPWHIQEGGCERVVTRSFVRGEPGYNAYLLSQEVVGKAYPVGRPGLDHYEVDLPPGLTPGRWLYRAAGYVRSCPTPRKSEHTTYAEFWVEVYEP